MLTTQQKYKIFWAKFHINHEKRSKNLQFLPIKKVGSKCPINSYLMSFPRVVMNDGGHDLGLQKADGLMMKMILHQRQWPLRSHFGSDRRTFGRGRKTDVRPVSRFAHGLHLTWRLLVDMASWNWRTHQEFTPTVAIPSLDLRMGVGKFTMAIFPPQFDARRRVIGLHQHFCGLNCTLTHDVSNTTKVAENSCNREENQGVRLGAEQFAWENDRLYTVEENILKSLIFWIFHFKSAKIESQRSSLRSHWSKIWGFFMDFPLLWCCII